MTVSAAYVDLGGGLGADPDAPPEHHPDCDALNPGGVTGGWTAPDEYGFRDQLMCPHGDCRGGHLARREAARPGQPLLALLV